MLNVFRLRSEESGVKRSNADIRGDGDRAMLATGKL